MGHFNIDLFKEHPHYFTDEIRDKTRQDIIMEKTDMLKQTLFFTRTALSHLKDFLPCYGVNMFYNIYN